MKIFKYVLMLSVAMTLFSCSYLYQVEYDNFKQEKHNEEKIASSFEVSENLSEIVEKKNSEIDSLYSVIETMQFTVDSLFNALEVSNSRVSVNNGFVIPDSLEFAGRIFDLRNERIYDKFEKIYNQELKNAHKFIPRSGKYFTYFDSVFTESNIPLDTKYLAIAESGLSPLAGSRVGARGVWQFMPKTAKGYGMRINSFVDDRLDVFVATKYAAQLLKSNYRYLKRKGAEDWLLAMCAYNAGAGSVARVVRNQGGTNFFDLIMQVDETNKYVWRAVAIKMIFENEKDIFGKKFERQTSILDEVKFVNISLNGHYKIDEWAKCQGTNISQVWQMNPWIKLYKRTRRKYSAVTDVVLPPGKYTITIPKNVDGDVVKIASLEKQFQKKNAGYFVEHIVKRGDNLYEIARKYKTTVGKIKSINGLTSNTIHPGKKLKLYGSPAASKTKYYVVKKGDSVGRIASRLGVKSSKLIALNKLTKKSDVVLIYPGQKLSY